MSITVESAKKSDEPGTGSGLMGIKNIGSIPKWFWYVAVGVVVLCILNRSGSKPESLPAVDLDLLDV